MRKSHTLTFLLGIAVMLILIVAASRGAFGADEAPLDIRGDWVAGKNCAALVRLRIDRDNMYLVNGKDVAKYGDLGVTYSFFGPAYQGIQFVAMPELTKGYPFMVTFNVDEKKGNAKVDIYSEMKGKLIPAVAKLQADAKALATRFPLDHMLLTRCGK